MKRMIEIYNDYIDTHIHENYIYEMRDIDDVVDYTNVLDLLNDFDRDFDTYAEYFTATLSYYMSLDENDIIDMIMNEVNDDFLQFMLDNYIDIVEVENSSDSKYEVIDIIEYLASLDFYELSRIEVIEVETKQVYRV